MTWHKHITQFYYNLKTPAKLPPGVEVLLPFSFQEAGNVFDAFYKKFYNDSHIRRFIVGINPGRFGGGITGIPFTDPIRLADSCGILNTLQQRQELSSQFIYQMIAAYGGVDLFYKHFYLTAYSPLGFTRAGKNLNYYDDKALAIILEPFAATSLREQLSWNANHNIGFCLGEGKNYQYLLKLNAANGFFKKIIPLPHPRFIMQYKLKQKEDYIAKYLAAFTEH